MNIEILSEGRLHAWCRRIDVPQGAEDALEQVAGSVRADPELLRVFRAFHQQTAVQREWHTEWSPLPFDPLVTGRLGDQARLFYLLAYLAALPYTEQEYQRRGIPEQVMLDTLWDIQRYILYVYDLHNEWRFDHFQWIWRHLDCKLFRLGRLQFMLIDFQGHITALRHKTTGEVRLLADPGQPLRADGYAMGAGQKGDEQAEDRPVEMGWTPIFEQSETGWRGHPISPYGCVLPQLRDFPRADWDCILQHGDPVLDLHIPKTKDLTEADCRASFQQAAEFFAWQYPDRPARASFCHTWFFTPQLQTLLPPESSIVRFQREFYLYPHAGGPDFLWSFVFGEKYPDPATAPRDTRLRRAVLDWLAEGKELFDLPGVLFHPPAEWGTQPYMTRWDQETR